MQKACFLLLVSLITQGCASDMAWRKEGVSSHDMQSALSECEYQVGLNKIEKSEQKKLITKCMQAKGYRWK